MFGASCFLDQKKSHTYQKEKNHISESVSISFHTSAFQEHVQIEFYLDTLPAKGI